MSFTEDINKIVSLNQNGLLAAPQHWGRIRLSAIATVLNGFPFESAQFSRDRGTPLIRIRDIVRSSTETYFDGPYPPEYLVTQGSLLVGMDGDFNAAFWTGPDALLNQRVCKVTVRKSEYEERFLGYVLPGYLKAINDHTSSVTVKHLSSRTLLDIPLPHPPRSEQLRIADRIDELFTDLAAGVAALERVKRNLARYRAAVLHAAVTGRLIKDQDGDWHQPKRWRPLSDVIGAIEQGWSPKCERQPATTDSEWAVMTTTAIQRMSFHGEENKRLPDSMQARTNLELQPGDLLITRAGPRTRAGIACLVRATRPHLLLCDKAYRFRCKKHLASPDFIELVLSARPITDAIERMKTGSSDSGLNLTQSRFRSLAIPVPSLSIQVEIVETVREKLSQIAGLESEIERGLARASRLRQTILKAAFSGSLV